MFHDAYKFPVVTHKIDKEEFVPKKQQSVFITGNENIESIRKPQQKDLKPKPNKTISSPINGNPRPKKNPRKSPNNFKLDGNLIDAIKSNYLSYMSSTIINTPRKPALKILFKFKTELPKNKGIIQKIYEKYESDPYIISIMTKYNYTIERIHILFKQHLWLSKASQMEIEKFEPEKIVEVTKEEILKILENDDCRYIKNDYRFVKLYFTQFKQMDLNIFKRILRGLDIDLEKDNRISLEQMCKIKYYFIDLNAKQQEYIEFGKKFFDPEGKKDMTMEELYKLLKLAFKIEKIEEDGKKESSFLKILVSNYMLCGIIDHKGKFNPEAFEAAYEKKKINIMSLVKPLINY